MSKKYNKQLIVHFLAVFSGKVGASGLGFIVSLIIARLLGPDKFGIFSFFLVWAQIGSCFVGDVFSDAFIRNYSACLNNNKKGTGTVLFNALLIRLFFGILLAMNGAFFSQSIALNIFKNSDYIDPIFFGCLASLAITLWTFCLSTLQASESFIKHGILSPIINLIRLVAIPILLKIGQFTLTNLILVFVGCYFICSVSTITALRKRFTNARFDYHEIKSQLHFSKWITISLVCLVLINFLSIPILGYFFGNHEVGIYAAGSNLLLIFEHITNTIITVQYPKILKLKGHRESIDFIRKSLILSCSIIIILLPVFYFIEPLILMIYGEQYIGSSLVFKVLFVGTLLTMLVQPLNLFFLANEKAHYWSSITMLSLFSWLLSSYYLVPLYAAIGAAIATLFARIVYLIASSVTLWNTFRHKNKLSIL